MTNNSNILDFSKESFDKSDTEESKENYNGKDEGISQMGGWAIDPCKYGSSNQLYGLF